MKVQKKSLKASSKAIQKTPSKSGRKAVVASKIVSLKKAAVYFPPDPC